MLTKKRALIGKRALNRIITVYHLADSNLLYGCAGFQDMRVKYLCHLGRRTLTLLEFRYTTKLLLTFHLFIIQETTLKHFITFVSVSVLGEGEKVGNCNSSSLSKQVPSFQKKGTNQIFRKHHELSFLRLPS